MEGSSKINVYFKNCKYEICIKDCSTIEDIKKKISKVISVAPEYQKIANICFKVFGRRPENEISIREVLECDLFDPRVTNLIIEEIGTGSIGMPEQVLRGGFKCLGQPRKNKNLLILDVDQTIYDVTLWGSSVEHKGRRPYLEQLLKAVYPQYDLALWSTTSINEIERKVHVLNLNGSKDYQFLFYADINAASIAGIPFVGARYVKPLQNVYRQFLNFNQRNTLICDDNSYNFSMNPKNGILVSCYDSRDEKKDKELLLLKDYLIHIASTSDNFSAVNHSKWKQFVTSIQRREVPDSN